MIYSICSIATQAMQDMLSCVFYLASLTSYNDGQSLKRSICMCITLYNLETSGFRTLQQTYSCTCLWRTEMQYLATQVHNIYVFKVVKAKLHFLAQVAVSTFLTHGQSSNGFCSNILLIREGRESRLEEKFEVWTDRDVFSHMLMPNGPLLANTEQKTVDH